MYLSTLKSRSLWIFLVNIILYLCNNSRRYNHKCVEPGLLLQSPPRLSTFFITMEEWKDIPGAEGKYEISTLWRLRSIQFHGKPRIKDIHISHDARWYCIATIYYPEKRITRKIHRLVAINFVPNPNNYKQINHLDGDKDNNHASNLEWCTAQHNITHSVINWLKRCQRGDDHYIRQDRTRHPLFGKKWKNNPSNRAIIQYDLSMKIIKEWEWWTYEINRILWYSRSHISKVCRWIYVQWYWSIWKYKIVA